MNKIAFTLDKLNDQLLKYQDDLHQRKTDPLIIQNSESEKSIITNNSSIH